jgi:hypothetical protein
MSGGQDPDQAMIVLTPCDLAWWREQIADIGGES